MKPQLAPQPGGPPPCPSAAAGGPGAGLLPAAASVKTSTCLARAAPSGPDTADAPTAASPPHSPSGPSSSGPICMVRRPGRRPSCPSGTQLCAVHAAAARRRRTLRRHISRASTADGALGSRATSAGWHSAEGCMQPHHRAPWPLLTSQGCGRAAASDASKQGCGALGWGSACALQATAELYCGHCGAPELLRRQDGLGPCLEGGGQLLRRRRVPGAEVDSHQQRWRSSAGSQLPAGCGIACSLRRCQPAAPRCRLWGHHDSRRGRGAGSRSRLLDCPHHPLSLLIH